MLVNLHESIKFRCNACKDLFYFLCNPQAVELSILEQYDNVSVECETSNLNIDRNYVMFVDRKGGDTSNDTPATSDSGHAATAECNRLFSNEERAIGSRFSCDTSSADTSGAHTSAADTSDNTAASKEAPHSKKRSYHEFKSTSGIVKSNSDNRIDYGQSSGRLGEIKGKLPPSNSDGVTSYNIK